MNLRFAEFKVHDEKDETRTDLRVVLPMKARSGTSILMYFPITGETKEKRLECLSDCLTDLRDNLEEIWTEVEAWDGKDQPYTETSDAMDVIKKQEGLVAILQRKIQEKLAAKAAEEAGEEPVEEAEQEEATE